MADPDTSGSHGKKRRSRAQKRLARGGILLLCVILLAEGVARFGYGLCDPPLYFADPEIEYVSQPSQDCEYLGRRHVYNAFSMRSAPISQSRDDDEADHLRVIVIGDSIVAGGVRIDQSQLFTELLLRDIRDATGRAVSVCNVGAVSWGPPNELAYIRRYGFFDADCIVFVFSSGDYSDAPTFQNGVGTNPSLPGKKPAFALLTLADRALGNIRRRIRRQERLAEEKPVDDPDDIAECLNAISEMLTMARETGAPVIVAQHLQKREVRGDIQPGYERIREVVDRFDVEIVQLGPAFIEAYEAGADPFLDWIHPNPRGHQLIARTLRDPILEALEVSALAERTDAEAGH